MENDGSTPSIWDDIKFVPAPDGWQIERPKVKLPPIEWENHPRPDPASCEGCVIVWIALSAALTVFCIGTAIIGWWM